MSIDLKKNILNHLIANTGAPLKMKDCVDSITRLTSADLQNAWNQWAGTTSNPRTINECAKILAGLTNQTVSTQDCLEFIDPLALYKDSFDVLLWLDATWGVYSDNGSTFATNGQAAQLWASKVSTITASQSTAASRPLYFASVANGRPGLLFDGTDDSMTFSSQITTSTPYLIFYVATNSDGTTGSNILGFSSSNAWYIRDNVTGTEGVQSSVATVTATATGETNGIHLGTIVSVGSGVNACSTYYNNGTPVTSTGAAFVTDGINAAAADSPSFLPGGFIHEIIIVQRKSTSFPTDLIEQMRLNITSYLSKKWGLGI